ncbi:MAG: TMEM175 family protein, partial [Candidatus Binatia bacterium]
MEEKETARVEAFSDGVFAFAMTLLVLEIKVPHPPPDAAGAKWWLL